MNEQIKAFLDSRDWLQNKGRFYETPSGDFNNYITIDKENRVNYRDVKVKIQIIERNSTFYELIVWFDYFRAYSDYAVVFIGFVSGLDDVIKTLELLGVDNKYLKEE